MHTITTPVQGFTGTVAGVQFADGVGQTDNPVALAYFRRHGYTVDDVPAPADEPDEADEPPEASEGPEVPAQSAPKGEWVAYATAHPDEAQRLSTEDAEALTKAALVERYGGGDTVPA